MSRGWKNSKAHSRKSLQHHVWATEKGSSVGLGSLDEGIEKGRVIEKAMLGV